MKFRKKDFLVELTSEDTERIYQDQVKIIFKQAFASVFALFFGVFIVVYLFAASPFKKFIFIWSAAVVVTLIWRLWVLRVYHLHPYLYTIKVWEKKLVLAMYSSAFMWGSIAFFIFQSDTLSQQFFLIFIIAGIASIASGTLASLLRVAVRFTFLILFPLFLVMFFKGELEFQMMGVLVIAFYLLLISASKRINSNIMSALTSKIMHEKAMEALLLSEEHFETIFKEAPTGIFFYNNNLIVLDSNAEMMNILQISRERMVGMDLRNLPDPCLNEALIAYQEGKKGFYEGPYTTMINKLQLWVTLKTSPIYDSNRTIIGGVAIVNDITERYIAQEKMQHQAYFDTLTDIPNRLLLEDRIEQSLAQYRRHNTILAILFLDLDHFKSVNDSLGHHIGDILLIETAKRLVGVCREGDTVARLGGDEFVILLNELGDEPHIAATRAEGVAEKIHEILSRGVDIGLSEPISTSSSIGISLVSSGEHTAGDLLKFADTAMYQAKKEGRNTTRFYQEQMDQWIKKRLFMENGLRHAIKNNELELYYQPLVEVKSKNIIGAEALLRWNHPTMGLVMPDEMINLAEESGLIIPIGDWVLKEACSQFVVWQNEHGRGIELKRLAVNVSVIQFRQNDFVAKVMNVISQTQMNPFMLEIELTESVIIEKMEMVIEKIKQLKEIGIGVSMDDFGTGYSSLSSLKQLPISTLKIDRSFIRDIMSDGDDAALVETIVSMASIFKLDVIAEGVETMDQLKFLEYFKCRYFQGYVCSKPVIATEFEELLETNFVFNVFKGAK